MTRDEYFSDALHYNGATLDWLRNTFEGQDYVDRLRYRRKEYRQWRKAVAKRERIEAAHAMVDNWLNALHSHEDPVGVWMRENDTIT